MEAKFSFFLFVREMLGLGRLGILSDSAGRASRRCYLCKPCTCSARCPHGHRWSVGVAAAVGVGLPFSALRLSMGLRRWALNLQSRARVRTNALEHAATN